MSGRNREMSGDRPSGRRETAGLSIGALRAFVATVDAGSFSRAALMLGVSQPNVSSQISALEQACGVRLLHRRSQNQILTDAGRELYVRARLVISRMEDFESMANLFSDLKRGRLVVGFSTPPVALRLIGEFMRTYPDIDIGTRLGNTAALRQDVLECRADAAILSLLEPDPQLACQLIAPQGLNLIAPTAHPFAKRARVTAVDLPGLGIVSREEGSVTRALTEAAFAKAGAPFRPILTVESREAVKEAVANGIGFGTVLDGEVGEDRRIKALPLEDLDMGTGVYIVSLRESLEIPAVKVFVELASSMNAI